MSTILEGKQEVIERIRRIEPQLRALGVNRLALFGSFVRDTPHEASDVDLLVEFLRGRKTFDNFSAVCELLEDSLGRPIELVTRESLSPHIGPRIMREAEDVIASA